MNLLLISLFAVASLSVFPTKIFGSTDVEEQEPPLALSLSTNTNTKEHEKEHEKEQQKPSVDTFKHQHNDDTVIKPSDNVASNRGEVWQEDDREVLIRNERGAKKNNNNNNNGGGSGASGGTSGEGGAAGGNGGAGKKGKNKKTNKQNMNADINKQQQQSSCRYTKSTWSECDAKSNTRSRTLSLKKGEEGCVQTRTIQKKCKKACRYEKGTWSECLNGQMSRTDKLKTTTDTTCQPTRVVNKNCNPGKVKGEKGANKERPAKNGNKDKGGRKSRA